MDEGYIKFHANWLKTTPIEDPRIPDLIYWRQQLYELGLIGAYPNGIGFGNISCRTAGNRFLISGSATGTIVEMEQQHIALVSSVHEEKNYLECSGPVIASSESMSHAVIYRALPWVNGVVHIHHLPTWENLLGKVPTTDRSAPYGSPEMARSILTLLETTDLAMRQIFVMEGHQEGVFTFGKNLKAASQVLLQNLTKNSP